MCLQNVLNLLNDVCFFSSLSLSFFVNFAGEKSIQGKKKKSNDYSTQWRKR